MKHILVLDNYDSFTYNLVQLLTSTATNSVIVRRNNKIDIEEVAEFDKIVLSPGPGVPKDAGIMPELIKMYAPTKSILGVCLGHQGIGECFGAKLVQAPELVHGKSSKVAIVHPDSLFDGLPAEFEAGRYHSWVIAKENLPSTIRVTASDSNGTIMAIRVEGLRVSGVQFHPESILTPIGAKIIENWIRE